jgi:hypothetical protein
MKPLLMHLKSLLIGNPTTVKYLLYCFVRRLV